MGAEAVIAVNLDADYFAGNGENDMSFYKIANNSIRLLCYYLSSWNVKDADLVISPKVGKIGWDKFTNSQSVILAGEKATRKALNSLRKII